MCVCYRVGVCEMIEVSPLRKYINGAGWGKEKITQSGTVLREKKPL